VNSQRFSLVAPAEIDVDLGLFTGRDSGSGVVVLGLASLFSSLEDSDGTVAVGTLVNDSVEVMEVRGLELGEIINSTIIRRTIDVKESKEATVVFDVTLSVKDHGTVIIRGKETTISSSAIIIDVLEGDVDASESEGREPKQADKQ